MKLGIFFNAGPHFKLGGYKTNKYVDINMGTWLIQNIKFVFQIFL